MALEVFAKLNSLGESCAEDHILIGSKQDFTNVSKWLNEQFDKNKRKRQVYTLSALFDASSKLDEPYVKLSKKETVAFHQALKSLSEVKKSAPLKKLVGVLDESLWVY